ncbi:MAG: hypothetical protein H0W96_06880 [Solirubrobacterales bacterium]|nr:hypothetical protein [Solirubrobacterales bacterium]
MSLVSPCRRLSLAVAAVAVTAAVTVTASPAMASDPAAGCPAAATSNPFAAWGDVADYQLAPGGDIEDGASSWSLTGGAGAVEGSETFAVAGSSDHLSLRLPGVSSATTARMCIDAARPSLRFFAKRLGGSDRGNLLVEVVYDNAAGNEFVATAGSISATEDWAPSASLPTVVSALAAAQGGGIQASIRFTPQGGGIWSVDDVYVDPVRRP